MFSVARVAGMAGENNIDKMIAYISRLRGGEAVLPNQSLQLRSVERAALASWVRQQKLLIQTSFLSSSAPFTVHQLLSHEDDQPLLTDKPLPAASRLNVNGALGDFGAVGIDIEDVDNFPPADDYREHPFYQDHFTAREIAYCIRQADVRASFCGTWAAKEALLKSGLVPPPANCMNTIEILRDEIGRPTHPHCSISISHTPRTAVAVCIVR
jgi:phosphopantetheine--protein transferase-like protein